MAKLKLAFLASILSRLSIANTHTDCDGTALYPNIVQTSHASREAVSFFTDYFVAKSSDDGPGWAETFNREQAAYYDATLGLTIGLNYSQLLTNFDAYAAKWRKTAPTGRSYPLRVLGDTVGGAIVHFVETPPVFGAEIRVLASFDFLNGTIRRQIDNWNGRGNIVKGSFQVDSTYPYPFGAKIQELAAPEMQAISQNLNAALSSGNASAAAAMFSYNAIWEDYTLSTRIEGQIGIKAYLQRALSSLPYGPGTELYHVLGSATGGGYEWRPQNSPVLFGITALEVNQCGNITRFTTVWDGSTVNLTTIQGLAELAPTP